MEKPRKASVTVLAQCKDELLRVSTYNDVTDIRVQEHVTVLYTQEFPYNDSLIIGVISNAYVLRVNWESITA